VISPVQVSQFPPKPELQEHSKSGHPKHVTMAARRNLLHPDPRAHCRYSAIRPAGTK
jgi:hypothetical protein